MARLRTSDRRRGAILVQFALLSFAFFAIAGLLVDFGLVRLTRTQMQSAADLAALEGLRERDVATESTRRSDAALLASWLYDSDLDVGTPDTLSLGAGPVVAMSDGFGDANAARAIDLSASGVYRPELQPNLADAPEGDLVAGAFDPTDTAHAEASDYTRSDFSAGAGNDAFLARLRRTSPDRDPLAREPDVSSSGPTLPLLFGMGSTIAGIGNGLSLRRDGFTVRALAVARAVPAAVAGRADAASGTEGVTPFAVARTFWSALTVGVAQDATAGTDGVLVRSDLSVELGRDLDARAADEGAFTVTGFVPVFDVVAGVRRVVGFGRADVAHAATGAVVVQVTKRASRVAPANASASSADGFPADAATLDAVETAHAAFAADAASQPLLAPGLVR